MSEWISVRDRLPDHACKVLVCARESSGYRHVTVSQFTGNYFQMTGRRSYWKVTHWMELPEPPTEYDAEVEA